jgi:uncharacterized membrane protein YeiH
VTQLQILLALDVLGTLTFALNGALTATRRVRLDIVGVLALGIVTATGGGMIRDVLVGDTPPAALRHWYYLVAAIIGSLAAWLTARPPRAPTRAIILLDAVGLSVFAVAGAQKAVAFGRGTAGLAAVPAAALGAALCFVIRVVGVRFKLQAPSAPPRVGRRTQAGPDA